MSSFLAGFGGQLSRLFRTRRLRVLLALFLGSSAATAAIYSRQVVLDLPVALLDLDHSRLSRTIRQTLESTPELRLVEEVPTSVEQAQEMMTTGRAVAVVLIPNGLQADLKRGRRGEIVTSIDMSNLLVGKTAWKALFKSLTMVSGGLEITWLRRLGDRSGPAKALVQPIGLDDTLAFNPATSYAVYVAPALVFFLLHILLIILAAAPYLPLDGARSRGEMLGRQAALLVVGVALGALLAYGLLPRFGVEPQSGPAVVLAVLGAFCLGELLMVAAFQAAIPSPTLAFQAALLVGMLSLMLSGVTFPIDAFPKLFHPISAALPFTAFARGFRLFLAEPLGLRELGHVFGQFGLQALSFLSIIVVGSAVRRGWSAARAEKPC